MRRCVSQIRVMYVTETNKAKTIEEKEKASRWAWGIMIAGLFSLITVYMVTRSQWLGGSQCLLFIQAHKGKVAYCKGTLEACNKKQAVHEALSTHISGLCLASSWCSGRPQSA